MLMLMLTTMDDNHNDYDDIDVINISNIGDKYADIL